VTKNRWSYLVTELGVLEL